MPGTVQCDTVQAHCMYDALYVIFMYEENRSNASVLVSGPNQCCTLVLPGGGWVGVLGIINSQLVSRS